MPLSVRHTPRANWHKYNGAEYFVTICTGGREHYFGEVHNGQTQLSAVGECLRAQIENIKNHYPYATIPLYVIMPNHTHLIVVIDGDKTPYDRTVCRDAACHVRNDSGTNDTADIVGTRFIASVNETDDADAMNRVPTGGVTGDKNPMLNETLGTVVRGLKARVTKFARENGIPFAWQPRYHDRIVHNQNEMNRIAEYIEQNPARWESDCFYNVIP